MNKKQVCLFLSVVTVLSVGKVSVDKEKRFDKFMDMCTVSECNYEEENNKYKNEFERELQNVSLEDCYYCNYYSEQHNGVYNDYVTQYNDTFASAEDLVDTYYSYVNTEGSNYSDTYNPTVGFSNKENFHEWKTAAGETTYQYHLAYTNNSLSEVKNVLEEVNNNYNDVMDSHYVVVNGAKMLFDEEEYSVNKMLTSEDWKRNFVNYFVKGEYFDFKEEMAKTDFKVSNVVVSNNSVLFRTESGKNFYVKYSNGEVVVEVLPNVAEANELFKDDKLKSAMNYFVNDSTYGMKAFVESMFLKSVEKFFNECLDGYKFHEFKTVAAYYDDKEEMFHLDMSVDGNTYHLHVPKKYFFYADDYLKSPDKVKAYVFDK